MALEIVKLDSRTLPSIADAIRAKTGNTALLLPSQMVGAISSIKTLHIETGTITPAEDTTEMVLPCTNDPKMICIAAADAEAVSAARSYATLEMVAVTKAYQVGSAQALTPKQYAVIIANYKGTWQRGITEISTAGKTIKMVLEGYPWAAGAEYVWTAYDWEDTV